MVYDAVIPESGTENHKPIKAGDIHASRVHESSIAA
ncbi:Uncharacterised protein [Vibrio cholerae]|nr:Uncharacterised protein [Vibrio cholerae]